MAQAIKQVTRGDAATAAAINGFNAMAIKRATDNGYCNEATRVLNDVVDSYNTHGTPAERAQAAAEKYAADNGITTTSPGYNGIVAAYAAALLKG